MYPDAWHVFLNIRPYCVRASTPSWIRAPPESMTAMTGTFNSIAISSRWHIFLPSARPIVPPRTEKSWAYTPAVRPMICPKPVTTAEPGISLLILPPLKRPISWKVLSSKRRSRRSRAVYFPFGCWRSRAFSSASAASFAAWTISARIGCRPAVVMTDDEAAGGTGICKDTSCSSSVCTAAIIYPLLSGLCQPPHHCPPC